MRIVSMVDLFLLAVTAIVAQKSKVSATAETFGTDQPNTVKLPLPIYPMAAKRAALAGPIVVNVSIDERGRVILAEDTGGPYPICRSVTDPNVLVLRAAAVAAAQKARFKPLVIDNKPVSTKGTITFTFESGQTPQDAGLIPDQTGAAVIVIRSRKK